MRPPAVGVTGNFDQRLFKLFGDFADAVKHAEKIPVQVGACGFESNVAWHVECDVVTHTGNTDPSTRHFLAQFRFLNIHVVTNTATGKRAYTRANQRVLPAFDRVVAGHQPDHGAGGGADQRALRRLAGLRFTGVRVDGLTTGNNNCHQKHYGYK